MALSSTRSSISTIACKCPLEFIMEDPHRVDQNGLRICDRAPQIVARRPLFDFGRSERRFHARQRSHRADRVHRSPGNCRRSRVLLLWLDYPSYRRLERRLSPRCGAQLDASIVEVEVDRPFGQADDFCDLRRGLPTRHPGQRLNLAIIQHRQLGPYLIARDARKPGINMVWSTSKSIGLMTLNQR
jgi:hypothetical protein